MIGEANFSDHGANRLGASALMQGLADGYFILPSTIGDYLASAQARRGGHDARRVQRGSEAEVAERTRRLLGDQGQADGGLVPPRAGQLMWDKCGMARNAAGLQEALRADSRAARGVLAQRERARAATRS